MDFSTFARAQTDIEIARSATVWELKVAIENLFSDLYDDAQKTISWYAPIYSTFTAYTCSPLM